MDLRACNSVVKPLMMFASCVVSQISLQMVWWCLRWGIDIEWTCSVPRALRHGQLRRTNCNVSSEWSLMSASPSFVEINVPFDVVNIHLFTKFARALSLSGMLIRCFCICSFVVVFVESSKSSSFWSYFFLLSNFDCRIGSFCFNFFKIGAFSRDPVAHWVFFYLVMPLSPWTHLWLVAVVVFFFDFLDFVSLLFMVLLIILFFLFIFLFFLFFNFFVVSECNEPLLQFLSP